jgi:hypothetical protein
MNEATSRAIEVVAIAAKVKHTESRDAMGHYSDLKRLEADGETYQTGFEDGATWVLDKQLLFSPAGVWRNGIPKNIGVYFIKDHRQKYASGPEKDTEFYDSTDQMKNLFSQEGYYHLDESASPAPVEGLREALEKIAESNKHDSELHRRGYKDKCLVCIATEALKNYSPSKEKEV